MKINRIHIGSNIEQKLNELGISKSEFGRKIGIPQQNVNRILDKSSIDTDKLITICEALDFNFFNCYVSNRYNNTATANGDSSVAAINSNVTMESNAVLAERVKHLEELLSEKERLIKVYEKMMEGK